MEDRGNHRQDIGRKGEEIACNLLRSKGHVVIKRNWRNGHLEIDIISLDADGIHFVEVKTRSRNIQAPPQMSVDRHKQRNITNAALRFLKTKEGMPFGNHECFFDIVTVTFQGNSHKTEWFPQAYIPIYL